MILDRVLRNATEEERKDIKEMLALLKKQTRKQDFEPYVEPFRPLNEAEVKSIGRKFYSGLLFNMDLGDARLSDFRISYQAQVGGFTICNIIVNGRLYAGSSHCIKSDRWLKIRGQMIAFRRALESEGIVLPVTTAATTTEGEK